MCSPEFVDCMAALNTLLSEREEQGPSSEEFTFTQSVAAGEDAADLVVAVGKAALSISAPCCVESKKPAVLLDAIKRISESQTFCKISLVREEIMSGSRMKAVIAYLEALVALDEAMRAQDDMYSFYTTLFTRFVIVTEP